MTVFKSFYLRSGLILLIAVLGLAASFVMIGSYDQTIKKVEDRYLAIARAKAQVAAYERETASFTSQTLNLMEQSIPGPLELGLMYAHLEALAQERQLTLRYNFHGSNASRGVAEPTGSDTWRISVDYLGSATGLRAVLDDLESGLYHFSVEHYTLDVVDQEHGQLSLELYLYGQVNNHTQ